MSCFSGPNIAKDGLLLHLDATNPRSYPGSGTEWLDLSGNGNHFTLFNSPLFSGSYLNFSGVDEYARSTNTLDLSPYDDVIVEFVFAANSLVSPSGMAFEHSENWNSKPMGFGLVPNSSGNLNYVANSHHTNQTSGSLVLNYSGVIGTNVTSHVNIWTRISGTGRRRALINTVLRGAKTTGTYPSFRNDFFYISSRAGTGSFANHKVYSIKIYGTSLTDEQIQQNFEAKRGRYGI